MLIVIENSSNSIASPAAMTTLEAGQKKEIAAGAKEQKSAQPVVGQSHQKFQANWLGRF
jgi:hypothetical protein